jgi:hypothetical protein
LDGIDTLTQIKATISLRQPTPADPVAAIRQNKYGEPTGREKPAPRDLL